MSGKWYGAGVNRMWHRGHQRTGGEADEVRRVLAEFRAEHGWKPGWVWNPYRGAYEPPQPAQDSAGGNAA